MLPSKGLKNVLLMVPPRDLRDMLVVEKFSGTISDFLGGFSVYVGIQNAFVAKLHAVILDIEIAHQRGWHNLWLESDSQLVIAAFENPNIVPWEIRGK